MYYRFQGPGGDGLFQVACPAKLSQRGVPRERALRAERLREWLWSHTPVPPGSAYQTAAPGARASTWFQASASAHIRAAWELAELLGAVGVPIRLLRSARPGRVIYSDDVQVVVWSGRDLPHGWAVPRFARDRRERRRDRSTIRRWKAPHSSGVPEETWALVASQRLGRSKRRTNPPARVRAEDWSAYPPP